MLLRVPTATGRPGDTKGERSNNGNVGFRQGFTTHYYTLPHITTHYYTRPGDTKGERSNNGNVGFRESYWICLGLLPLVLIYMCKDTLGTH